MKAILVVILVALLAGCATSKGFNRDALRDSMSSEVKITDKKIEQALEAKAQLPKPFKLAVYYDKAQTEGLQYASRWGWKPQDKDIFESYFGQLVERGEISEVISLDPALIEGNGNRAIRLAAARAGADAVIIVNGVADTDRYNNPLGVTYILLVTGAFVPGTELDALLMLNASMWDVRNEFLYLSVSSEETEHQIAPAFFIEEEDAINEAKPEALKALGESVARRITKMANK